MMEASVTPINNFVSWFQAISANMDPESQRRTLDDFRKAASSVFMDVRNKTTSITVETTPVQKDVRRVEYSVGMATVVFIPQNKDE